MGHFSVEIYAPPGSNLSGNQQTKGYRKGDAQLKAETMKTLWVPGVNNLGSHGRWAFAEFTDVFEIEASFAKLIDELAGPTGSG